MILLTLSIVIITSLLAAIALFFLLGSHISQPKKQQILIIMGILIFFSLMISNFKSQDIITFSLLNSVTKNKLNSIFIQDMIPYTQKYHLNDKLLGNYLFKQNYEGEPGLKNYQEYIIYLSDKDQGASYFLYQLAQKLRNQAIPTFYLKMESPAGTTKEFFRKTSLNSFEAFKHALDYYTHQKTKPYIIVDNPELLPRPIWTILASYPQSTSPHIIFNTENVDSLLQKMTQFTKTSPQNEITNSGQYFLQKFQIQHFIGPDQTTLQKLSPSNCFSKKLPINFDIINHFRLGSSQQQILLKNTNIDNTIAHYFGLSSYYNQIKKLLEKGPILFGKWRQSQIPFEILQLMVKLKLVGWRNGLIIHQ